MPELARFNAERLGAFVAPTLLLTARPLASQTEEQQQLIDHLPLCSALQPGGTLRPEKNPETNQIAYIYTFDTDTTCGTHDGDLVKRIDPQGTVTCYAYDALHRSPA
jgi:hypothetical protein